MTEAEIIALFWEYWEPVAFWLGILTGLTAVFRSGRGGVVVGHEYAVPGLTGEPEMCRIHNDRHAYQYEYIWPNLSPIR